MCVLYMASVFFENANRSWAPRVNRKHETVRTWIDPNVVKWLMMIFSSNRQTDKMTRTRNLNTMWKPFCVRYFDGMVNRVKESFIRWQEKKFNKSSRTTESRTANERIYYFFLFCFSPFAFPLDRNSIFTNDLKSLDSSFVLFKFSFFFYLFFFCLFLGLTKRITFSRNGFSENSN